MKKKQIKTLACLLKNPRLSDRKIADLLGISQPTVSRQRQSLTKAGMLTFSAYPNLAKLGYSIIAFTELYEEGDEEMQKELQIENSVIYFAELPTKLFVISVHKDIEGYELFRAKYPCVNNTMHITTTLAKTMKPLGFSQLIKPDK